MISTWLWVAFVVLAVLAGMYQAYDMGLRHGLDMGIASVPAGPELVELRARNMLLETEAKMLMTPDGRAELVLARERERLADILADSAKLSSGFPAQVMRHNAMWLRAGGPDHRKGGRHG